MSLRWSVRAHDIQLIRSIEQTCKVSPVVAQILAVRGITHPQEVTSFFDLKLTGLRPPEQLPGVSNAVQHIYEMIQAGKKIVVYGDYDCDGMTSTAILYRCIKLLGGDAAYHVPSRLDDGYGVSIEALDGIKKKYDPGMVVTVDCGINSVTEVQHANSIGIGMVITDHHVIGPELPDALAIVHPALPGFDYPFTGLCGAGIAFKLAWALCQKHHGSDKLPPEMRDFLFAALSLAAIGTVADVVPMLDENRILVNHGLKLMRQFANHGLSELLKLCKLTEKKELSSEDIGFGIGPRLNAAGRLNQARLGVELLTINDDEERARSLAEYIDQLNKQRNSLDRGMLKAANKIIERDYDVNIEPALVLAEEDWQLGVIGIVAGRVAERYHRPTIMISIDKNGKKPATGSARSACGVNLYEAIKACSEHLIKFGGHPAAAGLTIEPEKIDEFREAFCHEVREQLGKAEMIPELNIDAEVPLSQLTLQALREVEQLAPFGQNNPRPIMCATDVKLAADPQTMGKDATHLSLQLEQHNVKIRAVGFGKSEWAAELENGDGCYDFAFKPVVNEFRGRRNVELQLIDFRKSGKTI